MPSSIKRFSVISAALLTLAGGTFCKAGESFGLVDGKTEIIYYPQGWRLDRSAGTDTRTSITLYRNYSWLDDDRPDGAKGWASITLRNWNCEGCAQEGRRATIDDYVADKQCKNPKCDDPLCPVHADWSRPRNRLTDDCSITSETPRLTGSSCGEYFLRDSKGGVFYHYFRERTGDFSPGEERLTGVMVIFLKGNYIYSAELICPEGEYELYRKALQYVVVSLKVKKKESSIWKGDDIQKGRERSGI